MKGTIMNQKKKEFCFKIGENRVYVRDLETVLGFDCSFPDVTTVAYLLTLKGYHLTEIYSDGFCVVLNNQKEVENVRDCICNLDYVIGLPRTEEEKEARVFHKKAEGLYLTAMQKVCAEAWQFMYPDLQGDAINWCTASSDPNHSFHFFANVENKKY